MLRKFFYAEIIFILIYGLISCSNVNKKITHSNQNTIEMPSYCMENLGRFLLDEFAPPEQEMEFFGKFFDDEFNSFESKKINIEMDMVVQNIGDRIAKVAPDIYKNKWKFKIIIDDSNPDDIRGKAYSMIGGNIYITDKLIYYLSDAPNALAFFIAHEIAHNTERHIIKYMMWGLALNIFEIYLTQGVDKHLLQNIDFIIKNPKLKEIVKFASFETFGGTTNTFFELPLSRNCEYDADRIGLIYAARAGYDPRKIADDFNKKFVIRRKKNSIFAMHPTEEERYKNIKISIPDALKCYYNPLSNECILLSKTMPKRKLAEIVADLPFVEKVEVKRNGLDGSCLVDFKRVDINLLKWLGLE